MANTKDRWLITATIYDEPRRELWIKVFPYAMVPIKSVDTVKVNVPGHPDADAYMLDLDAITDLQREHLIMVISMKFDIAVEDVRKDIDKGVPILAEGVTVAISDEDSDHYYGEEEEDQYLDYEED